ncbi:DUF6491 family protein [Rhizorhapis sp. SPR117]|uniref:DUF6491 family protein n=1 Tax=Rhizorhapis sp. SPR117 TaxID=2912611 RepID=UPI001F1ECD28|nr:DUF6491 family protein [Rhizorhapis sp. SPR117]
MRYKEAIAAALIVSVAVIAKESKGATPKSPVATSNASIPFVNSGSIRDWSADGSEALYIQDIHGQWYHARLMGYCPDLPFVETIGFETRGIDTLDHFGTVIVRGQRCAIQNMVESDPPPAKGKHHKQSADKAAKER